MPSLAHTRLELVPVILAAGPAPRLGFPHAMAEFGGRTAVAVAVENCVRAGLRRPVVVLGCKAQLVRHRVPHVARVVISRRWRDGMLASIRAGLRHVPRGAAVMLYPVDLPLLTPAILRRLVSAFASRRAGQAIVSPVHHGRAGHPVILAAKLRDELRHARTAREVVEHDPRRVELVRVSSRAIYTDFATPADLRRVQRAFARRRRVR